jgi:Na+/melibiose symporter-like transporter
VTGEQTDSPAPASLLWAVRLLLLQAAGLAALTVYLVVRLLTADDALLGVAVALIVMVALGAAAVAVVARSLGRRRSGARGPAVVVQLMVIAAGGFLVQTGPLWLGLVLMALGLLVGLLIVLPSSTRALGVD